ncbi:hypothetical protein ES705_19832 [subsurface metagenome]
MDEILVCEILTNEIAQKLSNPNRGFILSRVEMAYGAGYDKGKKANLPNMKQVVQMDLDLKVIKIWDSATAAARCLEIHPSAIARYASKFHKFSQEGFKTRYKNTYRTAAGYIWKYLDE